MDLEALGGFSVWGRDLGLWIFGLELHLESRV